MKLVSLPSCLIGLLLFCLSGCGEEEPCERLQRCCDALVSIIDTNLICVPIPFEEDECQADLDALPDIAMSTETPLPEECTE